MGSTNSNSKANIAEVSQESGNRSISSIVADYASRKANKQTPESKVGANVDGATTVSTESEGKNVKYTKQSMLECFSKPTSGSSSIEGVIELYGGSIEAAREPINVKVNSIDVDDVK